MSRFILHSDLNNFYASVECLYNPNIRNKAVVVVGDHEKRHGIVLAKNYIAKSYGIKTGDTLWEAQQKCGEELVCQKVNFPLYIRISKLVKDIYKEYTDRVENFGIDEAWLDISHLAHTMEEAKKIADEIRVRVINEIGLTVSIGVSFNKIFAKLGSDLKKPNATTIISEDNFQSLVWPLPIEELLYVGKATKQKLYKLNIKTIGDLALCNLNLLKIQLGKMGETLWKFARGLDDSEVTLVSNPNQIKSIGNSTTCPKDLTTLDEVEAVLYILAENIAERMHHKNFHCKEVSLYIKDNTLYSFERQKALPTPTNLSSVITKTALEIFKNNYTWSNTIRAIGIRVSGFNDNVVQCNLFTDENLDKKKETLERTIENLRQRFGYNIIKRANIINHKDLVDINPKEDEHIIHPVGFFKPR
ncbi:MAG: DNA polymerase IV [Clostridia bacterium]|nr:DNA polymerase IV [Clostridia bacterium]